MTTAIQLYDIEDDVRLAVDDECPTCHNEPYVDVENGGACPDCGGDPNKILERHLEPLRFQPIAATVKRLARRVVEMEAEAEVLSNHAKSIAQRAATRERTVAFLKGWIQREMEAGKIDKVKDEFTTVYLQDNPASIEVDDEQVERQWVRATLQMPLTDVPAEFEEHITHRDVLKTPLADYFKETGHIPTGVTFLPKGHTRHLRIRS